MAAIDHNEKQKLKMAATGLLKNEIDFLIISHNQLWYVISD